ncbi:hypothetical protein ACGC1H_000188 [Rhizoctonia solani]
MPRCIGRDEAMIRDESVIPKQALLECPLSMVRDSLIFDGTNQTRPVVNPMDWLLPDADIPWSKAIPAIEYGLNDRQGGEVARGESSSEVAKGMPMRLPIPRAGDAWQVHKGTARKRQTRECIPANRHNRLPGVARGPERVTRAHGRPARTPRDG